MLFVLATSLRGIAGFYTDYLWFDSLNLAGVWRGVLGAKVALAVIFTGVFFALMWTNLFVADRMGPRLRLTPSGPEDDLVERYHELVGARAGQLRIAISALLAVLAGAGVSAQWRDWILFTNRVDFGQNDATFDTDIGFYVFQLPFLNYVAGWLFSSLVIVLVATVLAHYLNGGIRVQAVGERASAQVKAHVSVLLGLLALVKAGQYWLDRYELVFSTRGTVDGATYTDFNVQLKAIYLLIIISITAFVLFLVNIRRRGWVLPVLAVGLWAFVAILAGSAVPAFVQRFRVQPDEPRKEATYIRHNVAATREGMGLDQVDTTAFKADGLLDSRSLARNADIVRNIRLWDPKVVQPALQRSQGEGLRDYYALNDVDVDRYDLDGKTTMVNVGARNLSSEGVPQKSWVSLHLTYTHGYGAVLSPSNTATSGGQPVLAVKDVPVESIGDAPTVKQPRVYIGEDQSGYMIVNSKVNEFDYQDSAGGSRPTTYSGDDGVELNSFVRRAAFALRFGDLNPAISGNVTSDSKILLQRDVRSRLEAAAPFLSFDSDPYPVVINDRILYVLDAYTTTNRYPNAQRADTSDVSGQSGLPGRFNYVRNSVKATVDAYDGTITLYVIDKKDPLARAYRNAFPELFTDGSDAPVELQEHYRYPEDLFRVQTTMWGRYHVEDPDSFYRNSDLWNVAPDPELRPATLAATPGTAAPQTNVPAPLSERVDPYYMQLRLPGQEKESFTLLRPFVAGSRGNRTRALTAFLAVSSDPEEYGKIRSYSMPSSRPPAGPQDVVQAINSNAAVSQEITLLCQRSSQCPATNLLVIPIEQSLLYVRPLYVEAEANDAVPVLSKVIVAFQTGGANLEVEIGDSLQDALSKLFGSSPATAEPPTEPTDPDPNPSEPGTTQPEPSGTPDEAQLVANIIRFFDAADEAYAAGDPVEAAEQIQNAEEAARALAALRDEGSSGSVTTTTTTEPDASTSTTTTAPGSDESTTTTTKPSA